MKKLAFISILVFSVTSFSGYSQSKENLGKSRTGNNSKLRLINITEVNSGLGLYKIHVDYSKHEINLSTIVGLGFSNNLFGGVGIGVSFYNGGNLVPIYADFRYFFNIKETRVFVFGDGGLFLNTTKTADPPKIMVSPGIGMIVPIGKNLSVTVGAGLFTQFREDFEHDSFIIVKNGMIYSFKSKK